MEHLSALHDFSIFLEQISRSENCELRERTAYGITSVRFWLCAGRTVSARTNSGGGKARPLPEAGARKQGPDGRSPGLGDYTAMVLDIGHPAVPLVSPRATSRQSRPFLHDKWKVLSDNCFGRRQIQSRFDHYHTHFYFKRNSNKNTLGPGHRACHLPCGTVLSSAESST